ncbi:MAG: hypothetical protein AAFW68_12535 [Pseudomonadota bacterium]
MWRMAAAISGILTFVTAIAGNVLAQSPQTQTLDQRLTQAASENRYRLEYIDGAFSGPAWEILLREARKAQFFLLGEEHGIAENPKLAAALFRELTSSGYSKVAIEISPPIAAQLDRVLREDGLEGLRDLYATPGGEPAFFGMKEEAEFISAVRDAVKDKSPVLWGADYEVSGDRQLIAMLEAKRKPDDAETALAALRQASNQSWVKYFETGGPQFIFSFAGDPELVRAVKEAWPRRDDHASWVLDTLEETLEINKLWVTGNSWASNERRGAFLRSNFLRHWRAEQKKENAPKVLAKFGASHLVRGRNNTETYDLGALLPELAEIHGGEAFSVLVLPGAGAMTAVLNPTDFSYAPAPAKDGYARGIEAITTAAYGDAFTLIDLRPLRPMLGSAARDASADMKRIVHGFDMMLMMSGSTASTELVHPKPDPASLLDRAQ